MAKTTIQIDPDLHMKLRIIALQKGITLKKLINDALRIAYQPDSPKAISAKKFLGVK